MITEAEYRIVPARRMPAMDVQNYYDEFMEHDGECKVLWLMKGRTAAEWAEAIGEEDVETEYFGFYVCGELAGMGRIKERMNHQSGGNFGYGIRPRMRGRGYAELFVRLTAMAFVPEHGLDYLTACVDKDNAGSAKAFERAGWIRTGRVFDWTGGRKAVEFASKTHCRD